MKEFRKKYLVFLSLAAIFMTVIGLFSFYKFKQSQQSGTLTQASHKILKDASRLRALSVEIISSYKEYMSTGDGQAYKIYSADKSEAFDLLSGISEALELDSSQKKLLFGIRSNFRKLTEGIEHTGGKQNAAILLLQKNLDTDIDRFISNEDIFFNQRIVNLIELNSNFYTTVAVGCFLCFLFLCYLNYYLLLSQSRQEIIQHKFTKLKERQARSFQATRDGLFEWKFQDHDLYWSARFKEMIGYEDKELRPSSEILEELMHPEDRAGFWSELHQHLRKETEEFSAFFRLKHKDGHWVWINARGRANFDKNKEPVALIGIHTDVTKLKEFELQLEHSKIEAEKANNAKSDFLAHMSHEIRTPLTAITGVAEILNMQSGKFDEKAQKLLAALNTSAITLRDLISDILDYAKIESGRISLEAKPLNIGEVLENLVTMFECKAHEKGLAFYSDFSALKDVEIIGDKARIYQILVNILGNALKFTAHGSIGFDAYPIIIDEAVFIEVCINDTGIGISAEEFDFIFSGFRQADSSISRKHGGVGLGLSIANNLAKLMGGSIEVISRQAVENGTETGSTFIVRFPANVAEVSSESSGVQAKDPQNTVLNLANNDKILVVEDYEGNIAFITHILNEMGVQYDLGRTGVEGVRLWNEHDYRLILMDIQMPEMDGISAVKTIRDMESESNRAPTPIIAMTAHAFSEDREKCIRAGFNDYLPKPLSRQALAQSMANLINNE